MYFCRSTKGKYNFLMYFFVLCKYNNSDKTKKFSFSSSRIVSAEETVLEKGISLMMLPIPQINTTTKR